MSDAVSPNQSLLQYAEALAIDMTNATAQERIKIAARHLSQYAEKHNAPADPALREEERIDLIEIGTDMGIFAIVNMLLEGATFNEPTLRGLSEICSQHIEEVSGMPAVVFAMMTKPAIEKMIKDAREGL